MSDRVIVLSGRPAQVKNVYDIALTVAGERTPMNSRDAPEFRGYCKSIWEDLDIERAHPLAGFSPAARCRSGTRSSCARSGCARPRC